MTIMLITTLVVSFCKDEGISVSVINPIDVTYYFIVLLIGSTYFGHYYTHHQELETMMLITTFVVSFCKDEGISVSVNL